jgi:hypothetical protein
VNVSGHEIGYEKEEKEGDRENHQVRESESQGKAYQESIADKKGMIFQHGVRLVFPLPCEIELFADAIDPFVQFEPLALVLLHPDLSLLCCIP